MTSWPKWDMAGSKASRPHVRMTRWAGLKERERRERVSEEKVRERENEGRERVERAQTE